MTRALAPALAVAGAVAGADQAVKAIVASELHLGEEREVTSFLDLVHARNDGVAFGLFDGSGLALTLVALAGLVLLVVYLARVGSSTATWVAVGAIGGGAAGNLIDRVARGEVVDYLDLSFWPAFNLADAAITLGVAALAILSLRPADGSDG